MFYLHSFWNFIFPPKCVFCKKESKNFLCQPHQQQLNLKPNIFCSQKNLTVYSLANYQSTLVKRLVFLYKFWGVFKISDFIAQQIINNFSDSIPKKSILVPIPLHWSRYIWRGYNQSQKLAKALQKQRPDLIITNNLKRIRKTKQQAALSKTEREKNMDNVFLWKKKPFSKNSSIFLIDDVFTSGATMHAAKKELEKHDFYNTKAIVFARTK